MDFILTLKKLITGEQPGTEVIGNHQREKLNAG